MAGYPSMRLQGKMGKYPVAVIPTSELKLMVSDLQTLGFPQPVTPFRDKASVLQAIFDQKTRLGDNFVSALESAISHINNTQPQLIRLIHAKLLQVDKISCQQGYALLAVWFSKNGYFEDATSCLKNLTDIHCDQRLECVSNCCQNAIPAKDYSQVKTWLLGCKDFVAEQEQFDETISKVVKEIFRTQRPLFTEIRDVIIPIIKAMQSEEKKDQAFSLIFKYLMSQLKTKTYRAEAFQDFHQREKLIAKHLTLIEGISAEQFKNLVKDFVKHELKLFFTVESRLNLIDTDLMLKAFFKHMQIETEVQDEILNELAADLIEGVDKYCSDLSQIEQTTEPKVKLAPKRDQMRDRLIQVLLVFERKDQIAQQIALLETRTTKERMQSVKDKYLSEK